jgi:hypothetical protein
VQGALADTEGVGGGAAGQAVGADEQFAVAFELAVVLEPGDGVGDTEGVAAGDLGDLLEAGRLAGEERREGVSLEGGDGALAIAAGAAGGGIDHGRDPLSSVADEGAIAAGGAIRMVEREGAGGEPAGSARHHPDEAAVAGEGEAVCR